MEPVFRPASPDDLEALVPLMREYYAFDRLPFDETAARNALDQLLCDEALGRVWLIDVAGALAGYLVLTLGFSLEYLGRDAFIDEVYLRPAYRGQGLGRQAFALAEATSRAMGVRALHLEVERSNTAAQSFYRRTGYVDHDRYLLTKRLFSPAESPGT